MIVKQLYSIIHVDEAIQTMEAGANNIGLVPTQMEVFQLIVSHCIVLIRSIKSVKSVESIWS